MGRLAVLVALALASCNYGASFADCQVRCAITDDCPDGFACDPDGYCRLGPTTQTCAVRGGDADVPNDGRAARCTGTPAACTTFTAAAACGGQQGCSFAAPSCTRTIECEAIATNMQCMMTPGCETDFATSTCRDIAGYCQGATEPACEAPHGTQCEFAGGCTGTPAPCATLAEAACRATVGCRYD